MNRSRTVPLTAVILLLVAATAFSQPAPPQPPGPPPGGPGQAGPPPIDVLADFLALTEQQRTSWQELHQQFGESMKPLHEQMQTLREQLKSQFEATTPDPTAIGTTMLAIRALEKQIGEAHAQLETSLEGLLTAEQLIRFEAFKAASQLLQRSGGQQGPQGPPPAGGQSPSSNRVLSGRR